MAIAMAGMLASDLATLGNSAWAVVFGVLTAWFAYRVVHDTRVSGARALLAGDRSAPYLVHSGAMLYMFARGNTMSSGPGMAGMQGMASSSGAAMQVLRDPTLAFVFALLLIGYIITDLDQMYGFWHGLAVATALPQRPVLAEATAGIGTATAAPAAFSGSAAGDRAAANSPASPIGTRLAHSNGVDGSVRSGAAGVLLSPGVIVGCRIAIGLTMALMFFLMI